MTISDRYFQRLVLGAVAIGIVALLIAGVASAVSVIRNQNYTREVEHSYRVEQALGTYGTLTERLEATRRGTLLRRSDIFYPIYTATTAELPRVFARIAALTSDNDRQRERLVRLQAAVAEHDASVARSMELMRSPNEAMKAMADFGVDTSTHMMRRIRGILNEMDADEARLLQGRRAMQDAGERSLFVVLGLTGVLLLTVAGGSLWAILRYTRDLNQSRRELRRLNGGLESAVAERTTDLQRANEEIQRFAYIVSHDLRSPLVNVMGFTSELEATIAPLAELIARAEAIAPDIVSPEARLAATEDLPEAIGFIRSSTQKMDRLINAILRLSREGRRPIVPVPLNMVDLAGVVRDGVQHRLNELGAEVEIADDLPRIVGDRLAVEQIMSNLIENAIKYLKPGRPGRISVRGRREGVRAVFEVVDNGRGIDPRDHERIFDLFRRSGVQDQPGEGLGLAHVRALAYRVGGVINCQSVLDEGATFRLSLPLELVAEQGIPA
ncbi:MAG: sensor histidine kinase [Janthinobacterium lividum]